MATQKKKNVAVCDNINQLNAMLGLPLGLQSTVEFALKDFELPLSREDAEYLDHNTTIDLFGLPRAFKSNINSSSNLSYFGFTVDQPMIVTGLCAYGYAEPHAALVEGNQFGPQADIEALAAIPASPINLRNQVAALTALLGAAPGNVVASPAHLEIGGPTWNFLWAYLQAFKLVMECPHSKLETVLQERLIDVGNCCSLVDFSGFGSSEMSHLYWVRRLNARLNDIQHADLPGLPGYAGTTANADPGYFLPITAEQNAQNEITPNRTTGVARSYGKPQAFGESYAERWFRLPYAMPLDENTKIHLTIERDSDSDGNAVYFNRMMEEGCMKSRLGPIPAVPTHVNFPIDEAEAAADPAGGHADFTQIPAGLVRIGLGLKGVFCRPNVCNAWKATIADGDGLASVMRGDAEVCGGCVGIPAGHVGE